MAQKQVLSVIFLALLSANVIQANVLPLGFWHHETLPSFINVLDIPRIRNFASSAASAASNAFRSYVADFPGRLNDLPNSGPHWDLLRGLINRRILSGFTNPAILHGAADTVADTVVSSVLPNDYASSGLFGRGLLGRGFIGRRLLGNYGVGNLGGGGGGDAASAGAASAVA
ncbi:uncharacterized protein [Anoplolepis gracilipes]|uniref:uncharacterized protein isoform X2 n=1 Tax=Anoplolepis gracilipes TaxID=354296 RepID=UPI003BA0157F